MSRNVEQSEREHMNYEEILYEVDDGIATVKFNRPQVMNAGTGLTYIELADAFHTAADDAAVRVIVLTGEGRGFCAGDDVNQLFLATPDDSAEARQARLLAQLKDHASHRGNDLDTSILYCPKPTIAAVNGPAVGYGCDIALMCDMRIASDKARMGEFYVRRGLLPSVGGLAVLPRIVGMPKAYELVLSGRLVEAEELRELGMVNKVVPHDQLEQATREFAAQFAAQAPLAQEMAKEGLRVSMQMDYQRVADYTTTALRMLMQTQDHREGALSFVERREPEFKGQ
jgi:enoyl-CoA hydratase/carnithine racemase